MDTVPDWMDRPVTRLSLTVLGCVQGWLLILEPRRILLRPAAYTWSTKLPARVSASCRR
jgi:hypothetical protein